MYYSDLDKRSQPILSDTRILQMFQRDAHVLRVSIPGIEDNYPLKILQLIASAITDASSSREENEGPFQFPLFTLDYDYTYIGARKLKDGRIISEAQR